MQVAGAIEEFQGTQFAEFFGALAVVRRPWQDGHEGDASGFGGEGIVNVVTEIQGGARVAASQDHA